MSANNTRDLDLYARFEPLIGFEEEIATLHSRFIEALKPFGAKTALDIGCGSGDFLLRLQDAGYAAKGIDLSGVMIERAKAKGANAEKIELEKETDYYDAATAVFDVVNYLAPDELTGFFKAALNRIDLGGAFIFDVNTLYGFEEVAQGSIAFEKDRVIGTARSSFDRGILTTIFDLFSPNGRLYSRENWTIEQYYHEPKAIRNALKQAGFREIQYENFALYDGSFPDKEIWTAIRP